MNEQQNAAERMHDELLIKWKLGDFKPSAFNNDIPSPNPAKIIIICGCGRSGTTLMRVILDTNSQIACGPESLLFLPVDISPETLEDKFKEEKYKIDKTEIEQLLSQSQSRAEFIERFRTYYLAKQQKPIWADKTARNVHRLDYIFALYPNAKVIHMLREPKDTVASLQHHVQRIHNNGPLISLEPCIERWKLAVSDGIKYRGHENYLEVRYKDLVNTPRKTIMQVCDFAGVSFEEAMITSFHTVKTNSRDPRLFPQNPNATAPISKASIGKWKLSITEKDAEFIDEQLSELTMSIGL